MKINMICVCFATLCALASCVLTGCSQSGGGSRNGLVNAAGTVTYNGAPVEGATIEMRPVDESITNCVAVGRTDAQGKFTLMTDRPDDGAMPGKYKTVVKKQVEMIDGMTREEFTNQAKADGKGDVAFDKSKLSVENQLPEQYADPIKTPLEIEIPEKGDKNIQIDLKD